LSYLDQKRFGFKKPESSRFRISQKPKYRKVRMLGLEEEE
jgi:hypothetical protein